VTHRIIYLFTPIGLSDMLIDMFVRTVKKKGAKDGKNTYEYLHLVQTARTPRGPRQELLLNLGTLPIKKSERRLFAKEVERTITGQMVIVKPRLNKRLKQCIEQTVTRLLEKQGEEVPASNIEQEKTRDIQKIDTHSIKTNSHSSIGAEHVCYEAYKKLGIAEFLEKKGVNERNRTLIAGLIIGRLLEPGSERQTKKHLESNSSLYELMGHIEQELPLTAYYQANDIILEHKESLERYLSEKELGLFDLKNSVLLYDLTNTYLEGSGKNNTKAAYGRSKEKRYECPLMTLGLVLTNEGFVKKSQLFSGNQAETKTLQGIIEGLEIQKGQIIVMDAGISSKENLEWLTKQGYTYLVCSRSKHDATDITDYQSVKRYGDGAQVHVALKKEGEELLAYCKSDRKAYADSCIQTRSEQLFTDALLEIKEGLSKPRKTKKYEKVIERIARLKERQPTASKKYTISVLKCTYNPLNASDVLLAKKSLAAKPLGMYVLRTNKLDYTAGELWRTYRLLNRVEDSFRYMKSHLGLRPIYHQLAERADAHLFISVLAYRIWNVISHQLRQKKDHRNWPSVKQALRSHSRYTLSYDLIKDNKALPAFARQCSEPTELQRSIYHHLNISTIPIPKKKLTVFSKM